MNTRKSLSPYPAPGLRALFPEPLTLLPPAVSTLTFFPLKGKPFARKWPALKWIALAGGASGIGAVWAALSGAFL